MRNFTSNAPNNSYNGIKFTENFSGRTREPCGTPFDFVSERKKINQ